MNVRAQSEYLTRRRLLRLTGLSAAASLLAACAPIGAPSPTAAPPKPAESKPVESKPAAAKPAPTTAPAAKSGEAAKPSEAAQASGQPKRGGTLRVAQLSDIEPKRVHSVTLVNYQLQAQIYDNLTRYDRQLKPQPELAESWSWSNDNRTLTLKVRQGVKFHTGRELDAEDITFNILRVKEERVASQMRPFANDIKDIQTPDKATVVLQFDEPRPAIFDMFEGLSIMDRETIAEAEEAKRLVGTGPFVWGQWTPGDRLTMTRNQNYWKPGQPYLDGVTLQVVPDAPSALVNLEAGSVDVVVNPSETDVARLRSDPKFGVLISEAGGQYYSFGANVTMAPLDNKKVRQAINYGIDRKRFVDTVLAGIGDPTSVPWPKHSPAYDPEQANFYAFNLERSRQLLQEAGIGAGGLDVTLIANAANRNLAKAAQIAQADLAKVNVRVKIEEQEPATFQQLFTGRKIQQMWGNIFGFNNMYPTTLMVQAFPWRVAGNVSYFEHPDYARLVKEGQVATDPAEQKRIFRELTQLVLDESFMYPLSPQKNSWALAGKVKGSEDLTFGSISFRGTWLDGS
jgi:peptide/nickel transport system substrate-binding protein